MKIEAIMLYDGDCAFCRHWIKRWRGMTGDRIQYEPYQHVLARFPQLTEDQCREAVKLILPGAPVLSGAHAALKALALGGRHQRLLSLYERIGWFGRVCEWCYQRVAANRSFFSRYYRSELRRMSQN